jgi:hypothetical protein
MPRVSQPIHIFPEPPAGFRGTQYGQRLNHRRITLSPIDYRPIVRGSPKPDRLTGPLNGKAALSNQVGYDLPSLSGP